MRVSTGYSGVMTVSRRTLLLAAPGLAAAALWPVRLIAQPRFERDPYTLGVASGCPQPDGVVLWTRLAPDPLAGGGMPGAAVGVEWEVAADDGFRKIVQRGTATATPQYAHSVHVEVSGLEPSRWYWYRFRAGEAVSPAGRTRTAPAPESSAERLRFALASCQQYEQGYYAAYRHLTADEPDLVIHVGDYIYESSWGRNHVRKHEAGEPETLTEYRNRYALYKSDENLKAAHAAAPWIVTWDDHEVQNDYANDRSQRLDPVDAFLARRAAAYQAYYEHMPLPQWARPRGSDMQLHMRMRFGQLAELHVLDGRQYRSHQVCPRPGRGGSNTVNDADCPARLDPQLSYLGATQERWLHEGLAKSTARWTLIAQPTLMAQADRGAGATPEYWTDGWDGYPKARERLLRHIAERRVANPVVLGGDVHTTVIADLRTDFADTRSPVLASEFCGTSISSQGPSQKRVEAISARNPHVKFINSNRRGYLLFDLSAKRCLGRIRVISDVADPNATIRDLSAYAVEAGRPGPQRA